MIDLNSPGFKHDYKVHGFNRNNAYLYCFDVLRRYDQETLNEVFNILKAANVTSTDYNEMCDRIFKALPEVDSYRDYEALEQKRKDGTLGSEYYRLEDYRIVQVDDNGKELLN